MKNNKIFAIIAIVFGIALLIGLAAYKKSLNPAPSAASAPAATVPNLIRPDSYSHGPENAAVTIVEFLDPECEACRAMHPIMKTLMAEFPNQIRLVTRYMPFHGNSVYAASALEEARAAGKFEEALDILFENHEAWASHHAPKPELIPGYLKKIGMDEKKLTPELIIPKHQAKIEQDRTDGLSAGVQATPTFFVNGVKQDRIGYAPLKNAIATAISTAK